MEKDNDNINKDSKEAEVKSDELVAKNAELLAKIASLEEQVLSNNIKIQKYEQQIEETNHSYASKLKEKMEHANTLVQEKITKLEQKYADENNEIKKYGIAKPITEIVNIIDQFKKAINFTTDDIKIKNFLMGFKMFATMFDNLLSDLNVCEIKVEKGQDFDPTFMEAFDTSNDPSYQENKVTLVISNAYKLHDRIIKYAVVKVNKTH
ncbi:MAG: nucleotide exchange factor GrpE [Mycoplasmataceae bacterium]|jgi:molecular chaperone GrpE|nr:nucleotide exchange factor GrpE [Mycoplasmataceae bacterium]